MRNLPSGFTDAAGIAAACDVPRTSVWLDQPLALGPGGAEVSAGDGWGLPIEAVVCGAAAGAGGGGDEPPNQPANGLSQLPLDWDCGGGDAGGSAEAVRVARAGPGTAGGIASPASARPAS